MKKTLILTESSAVSERIAPAEFYVLKFGKTEYTKGGEVGEYEMTEQDAKAVLADFAKRGKDVVIDYEHQTLTGEQAPAAGWIESLELTAEGLLAKVKTWTDKAKAYLEAAEYRYTSPVIHTKQGRPVSLHSVALTNHPATHGISALVAATDDEDNNTPSNQKTQTKGHNMEDLKKISEALGLPIVLADDMPADAMEETKKTAMQSVLGKLTEMQSRVEALEGFLKANEVKSLDDMTAKVKTLVPSSDLVALSDKLATIEAEKLVTVALSEGKLTEAQRAWATKYAKEQPQAFSDFTASAPVVCPGQGPTVDAKQEEKVVLSDSEVETFKIMGLSKELIEQIKTEKQNKQKGL